MFPKPEKKQKVRKPWPQNGRKQKKPIDKQKAKLLEHHKGKPDRTDRAEFPREVIAAAIERSGGICQYCRARRCETTHHVWGRGRSGRGVLSNAYRVCGNCHIDIESNDELKREIIEQYREQFGDRFFFDAQDWEEHNRREEAGRAAEEERRQRSELLAPLLGMLKDAANRRLTASEKRTLSELSDKQIALLVGLLRESMGTSVPKNHFGYGHFDD